MTTQAIDARTETRTDLRPDARPDTRPDALKDTRTDEPVEGSAALRVVVVNGSPSRPSKTMGLVDAILGTLRGMLPVEVSRIDVYRLGPGFTGAVERDGVPPDVEAALRLAEDADFLIAAVPVYRGSYPGMFKHFFDLVDQYALAGKPVLLAATGGGDHHALVLEHALRPLFAFFQALTVPVAVFASGGDFDGTTLLTPRVYGRIETGLADVADLLRSRATGAPAAAPPG
ncbi:FMN reductase [Actinomadura meyerae]|uniref:FMN reductase n=1 Tax=Actinomadura meyerae TaxID=240840 RepID=A0A239MIP7_9ACTN|nr:NAD(P)H-dependent oxidoreductase [Actinomadura meyerae]SNT42897.1 FMN reductase [Actinomadura meyerae]